MRSRARPLARRARASTAIVVFAAALAWCAAARAQPTAPLSHVGRWITDAGGRVVILHGFNLVAKNPPFTPASLGFADDDAAFLASEGFNTIRLGMVYQPWPLANSRTATT